MQAYGETMAMAYDTIWGGYAQKAARAIMAYQMDEAATHRRVLDLCCGAGQLAEIFLQHGFQVVGVDLSGAMLDRAAARCDEFVQKGQARFVQADAANFQVDEEFDLILSTYDALNHLDSREQLEACFRCARQAARPGASFIFDFSTFKGLDEWNRITVVDREQATVITRGFFDRAASKGYKKFTGFLRDVDGNYRRFEEVIFAVGHRLADVRQALSDAGFAATRIALLNDLASDLADPESEDRVLFVSTVS